jgi:hypothetical protein
MLRWRYGKAVRLGQQEDIDRKRRELELKMLNDGRGEQGSRRTVNEVADGVVRSPEILHHFEKKN